MRRFMSMFFIGLGLLGILGMAVALPSVNSEKVHLQMEEDELRQIFQTEPHAIPDYEVVSLQTPRLHERWSNSGTRIRLNAFGKDIQLWLNPIEGILASYDTPVYTARSSRITATGVIFDKIDEVMDVVGNMLEDREKEATLIVRRNEDGRSSISGTVGSEGWVVRPLPTRFYDRVNVRERRSVDSSNSTIGEYEEPHPHVIFKSPKLPDEARYTNKPIGNNVLGNNKTSRLRRSILADIIYPEILVVADHETYRRHGQNIYHVLEYLLPFWNGVDLRYRSLEFPKVRLNIAGIVIAMDWNALSYMETNKVDTDMLDIHKALSDFGKFLPRVQSTFPFPSSYDIAVTMTSYDMCWVKKNGARECGILGLAYVAGACLLRGSMSNSVAMLKDKGGFDGIATAVHELGHLFSADHDGEPGSMCTSEAGHIMAATPVLTVNSADWSPCSLSSFNQFFNNDSPKCLFNEPKVSRPMPLVLPGKLLTLDQQCAKIQGTKWCKSSESPCMRLKCVYAKDERYCISVGDGAADGTECDTNKMCVHGKCIDSSL